MKDMNASNWTRRLTVTTPEHVELRFETAGIGSRAGAQIIDVLLLILVNAAIGLLGWLIFEWAGGTELAAWIEEYAVAVLIILFAVLNGGYFLIAEFATGGRTIGKRVMGIRVVQDNGRPISFLAAAIRNLLRIVDALPALYFVGALFSFFHPHDKRLGDLAAGTAVVYELGGSKRLTKRMKKQRETWKADLPALNLEPWIRERVTEAEWALVSGFAERLAYLDPKRAESLAADIVELLAPKLGLDERWEEWKASLPPPPPPGMLPTRSVPKGRSVPVAWALALYEELRPDWELTGMGTDAATSADGGEA
ncbi:RDD family protein [Paenibacillus sp. TRM 82003]|nr:RDD family protein [Paenibacillus sp. TRM 82003]